MEKEIRNKPDISTFTGINFDNIEMLPYENNDNGEIIYVYALNDVTKMLNVKKKDIIELLYEGDYFKSTNLRGQEVTYLTEKGLFTVMCDLELGDENIKKFRSRMMENNVMFYNYGVIADEQMKDKFIDVEETITLLESYEDDFPEDFMDNIYKLLDETIDQIK